jgi:hypothetical protein
VIARATGAWILTASGRCFDLDHPRAEDVELEDIAHALGNLCRFAGHVRAFYSVAEHSVLVSTLVPERLQLAGLLHDAAEAYVGDVVGPLVRRLPEFRAVERRVLSAIARRFGVARGEFASPEIRRADAEALLIERDALLPPSPRPWREDRWGRPRDRSIVPMPPADAERAFLNRFEGAAAAKPR